MNEKYVMAIVRSHLRKQAPTRCVVTTGKRIDHMFIRENYGWLLWSNPQASDEVLRLNILKQADLFDLINLAKVYGPATLQQDYNKIQDCEAFSKDDTQSRFLSDLIEKLIQTTHAPQFN